MTPRSALAAAAVIILLMLLTSLLSGCSPRNAAGNELPRESSLLDFEIYYLFPGEPAPVEGPQLRTRDFERLLKLIPDAEQPSSSSISSNVPSETPYAIHVFPFCFFLDAIPGVGRISRYHF